MRGIRDVALDGVELRIFCLHLVQHSPAATCHDDFIAEFGKFKRESKADAGGASGDEDGAICKFHRSPFIRMSHRITRVIQQLQKISKAVQKVILHTG